MGKRFTKNSPWKNDTNLFLLKLRSCKNASLNEEVYQGRIFWIAVNTNAFAPSKFHYTLAMNINFHSCSVCVSLDSNIKFIYFSRFFVSTWNFHHFRNTSAKIVKLIISLQNAECNFSRIYFSNFNDSFSFHLNSHFNNLLSIINRSEKERIGKMLSISLCLIYDSRDNFQQTIIKLPTTNHIYKL